MTDPTSARLRRGRVGLFDRSVERSPCARRCVGPTRASRCPGIGHEHAASPESCSSFGLSEEPYAGFATVAFGCVRRAGFGVLAVGSSRDLAVARVGAEPWATPLALATKRGHREIVQLLRSAGALA
jgi:hypothetical protein